MTGLQNKVVSHIDLHTDLAAGGRPAFIYAKQYDAKSRYIIATIKNGDRKIAINGSVRFNAKKPDGTFFYNECQINSDGTVTIELDSQILSVDGEVSCDISVFDGDVPDQLILTTSTFFIIVEKSNYDIDAIKSSNIYTDLESAKVDAQEAATQAEAAMNSAENSSEVALSAAKVAQEAADRAELAGGGISAEVDRRLTDLENDVEELQVNDEDMDKRLDDLEKQLADLNYKKITASLSVSLFTAEVGQSVTNALLTWSVSKPTKSLTLDGVSVAGTSYTDTNAYTADKTWTLEATEADRGATATATATLTFKHRVYWGIGTTESGFDSDFVKALEHSELTTSKAITLNVVPKTQYIYYAMPQDLCDTEPIFVMDYGFAGGFEYKEEITVTNSYGAEIVYYVYRSDQLLVGSTRVDVS